MTPLTPISYYPDQLPIINLLNATSQIEQGQNTESEHKQIIENSFTFVLLRIIKNIANANDQSHAWIDGGSDWPCLGWSFSSSAGLELSTAAMLTLV